MEIFIIFLEILRLIFQYYILVFSVVSVFLLIFLKRNYQAFQLLASFQLFLYFHVFFTFIFVQTLIVLEGAKSDYIV